MTRTPSEPPFDPGQLPDAFAPAPVEHMPVEEPRRAASLTLRVDEVRRARAASMEAANQSLADALRITYRLIQVVMVALVVLFLFSGFQQVNQSESGIRVELGRIKSERLEPGFQFSLPYPLGEIVKIETGNRTLEVDDKFWPDMRPEQRRQPLDQAGVPPQGSLAPGRDGSLYTADSYLAHAQWSVVFVRARPAEYARSINPDFEQAMVKSIVERAAVQVAASVPIDDLLKPGSSAADGAPSRENTVEARVRRTAQEALDQIGSGLQISQVILRTATPPLGIRRDFNQVQIALSNAGKLRDQALGERSKVLNGVAGNASGPLLELIDEYEVALELADASRADELLKAIHGVMEGDHDGAQVQLAGKSFSDLRVSGEVSKLISEAQQYRATVVQQAQREAETFGAMLKQYRANPAVFLSGALADAYQKFLSNRDVQVLWIPDTTETFDLRITPDPEILRERERARYEKEVEGNKKVQEMRELLRGQE